jgi:hypothetical protein
LGLIFIPDGGRRKSPQKKTEEPESLPDNDGDEAAEPVAEEPKPTKRKPPARAAKPSGALEGEPQSGDTITPKARSGRGKKSDAFKAPTPVKPTLASTIKAGRGATVATEKKQVAAKPKPSGAKAPSKSRGAEQRKEEDPLVVRTQVLTSGSRAGIDAFKIDPNAVLASESSEQGTGLGGPVGDLNSWEDHNATPTQPLKQPKGKGKKAAASVQPQSKPLQIVSHLGPTNDEPDSQQHNGSGGSHAAGADEEIARSGEVIPSDARQVEDGLEVESVQGSKEVDKMGRDARSREHEDINLPDSAEVSDTRWWVLRLKC